METQNPIIALTFDDGPHPVYTRPLLDILARYQAQATFFMIGERAECYREIVQQVAEAGHTIGNHSWNHPSFPRLSHRERIVQMQKCTKALAPFGQPLFRPPYGHQDFASSLDVLYSGYQPVTWNVVAFDWLGFQADWLVERVTSLLHSGSIILFHDALYDTENEQFVDRQPTLEAVERLLQEFSKTFRFVTVPRLLQEGTAVKKLWNVPDDVTWLNSLHRVEIESMGRLTIPPISQSPNL